MNAQQKAYFSDCLCNSNLKSRITKHIYNEELKKSYLKNTHLVVSSRWAETDTNNQVGFLQTENRSNIQSPHRT